MVDAIRRFITWSSATSADEFLAADCPVALVDAVFRSLTGTGSGTSTDS